MKGAVVVAIGLLSLSLARVALGEPLSLSGSAVEGGSFRIDEERGRVVVLTVASRYTRGESERVNQVFAGEVDGDVKLVSIVEMTGIPGLFRGYARRCIRASSQTVPARFLVDDDGHLGAALGARPTERVDILVLGRDGEVRGRFAGEGDLPAALRLVRGLRSGVSGALVSRR